MVLDEAGWETRMVHIRVIKLYIYIFRYIQVDAMGIGMVVLTSPPANG